MDKAKLSWAGIFGWDDDGWLTKFAIFGLKILTKRNIIKRKSGLDGWFG